MQYTKTERNSVNRRYISRCFAVVFSLLSPSGLTAQRAFEANGEVIYEDAQGARTNLGRGFSPVLTQDGRVAFLRGRSFGYGETFGCDSKENRNWVSAYNPATKTETVLFNQPVPFGGGKWNGNSACSNKCNSRMMDRRCIS